jgi:DMSO/TMAO reductase YedYZ molybdopterin-dependent catalytic subunit
MSRRSLLAAGAAVAGGSLLSACHGILPPSYGTLIGLGDTMTYAAHRLLLPRRALAPEFERRQITPFPAINTVDPEHETYRRFRAGGFADWRLPIDGLVDRPLSLGVADLKAFPARTQVTQHHCERGWTAIAEWTGKVLAMTGDGAGEDH